MGVFISLLFFFSVFGVIICNKNKMHVISYMHSIRSSLMCVILVSITFNRHFPELTRFTFTFIHLGCFG